MTFPHVYDMPANPAMTLCLKAAEGATIAVYADGEICGQWQAEEAIADFSEVKLPLKVSEGEHDLKFVITGQVTLDWYSLV